MAKILIFDQPETLYEQCAQRIRQLIREVLESQEHCYMALAGGSTPRELYLRLSSAPAADAPDWSRVEFFFGDERCVTPEHVDSNYRMARQTLFEPLAIREEAIHRIRSEIDPDEAVRQYLEAMQGVPQQNALPRFDLVLLGMGADGHVASLFPGTALLEETQSAFGANYVEKLECRRLSLTLPTINNARHILLLVCGGKKADVVRHVLRGPSGATPLPVELLERENLEWFLDREAGHFLDDEYPA